MGPTPTTTDGGQTGSLTPVPESATRRSQREAARAWAARRAKEREVMEARITSCLQSMM